MPTKKKKSTADKPNEEKTLQAATPSATPTAPDGRTPLPFHIVGIGASAGGLDALKAFFEEVPADCGMAFVVVQHLSPRHVSLMKNLLAPKTTLEVQDAEDGMRLEPNRVYLKPPAKDIVIRDRTFHLTPIRDTDGPRLPIDIFFSSLAEDQKERAVCIILSGSGSDGTLGAKLIQGEGGLVMVQDEREAQYARMPQSIIDAGLADVIVPVKQMPSELLNYIRHPFIDAGKAGTSEERLEQDILSILMIVRTNTGHDFSRYKRTTVQRRIERRMALQQIQEIGDYRRYLRQNPAEIDNLFQDMTIKVTRFFRDPKAFEVLLKKALQPLLRKKEEGSPLRIWVPGCATGEEAYSLAVMALEASEALEKFFEFKIFASDINNDTIVAARRAYFPESAAADISVKRLKRFFSKKDHHYLVDSKIRDMILFAVHDIGRDPPFSNMDLISCRNLLIYMNSDLQADILQIFRYALKTDGILFMGSSETTGGSEFFTPVDKKHKIYRKKIAKSGQSGRLHFSKTLMPFRAAEHEIDRPPGTRTRDPGGPEPQKVRDIVEQTILDKYAYPAVLIDDQADILYFHGNTGKFLAPPVGEPSFNVFAMTSGELHYRLAKAIEKVKRSGQPELLENLQARHNDSFLTLDVSLSPLPAGGGSKNCILIEFKETSPPDAGGIKTEAADKDDSSESAQLAEKLRLTRQELQAAIEELETSNEELKSANEELQANNEELQSTNEELESSKEELQSTNEELETVNTELSKKNQAMQRAEDDLDNLFESIELAILFLSNDLRIVRFTPAATEIFNLKKVDEGRRLLDITSNLDYDHLARDVEEVLDNLIRKEVRVNGKNGNIYVLRIVPYRSGGNVIEGAIVSFTDVSFLEDTKLRVRDAISYFENTAAALWEPILILDENFEVSIANPAFYREFKTTPKETLGQSVFHLGDDQWNIPELRRFLEEIIPQKQTFENWQVEHDFPRIGHRKIALNGRRIEAGEKRTAMILLSFKEVV